MIKRETVTAFVISETAICAEMLGIASAIQGGYGVSTMPKISLPKNQESLYIIDRTKCLTRSGRECKLFAAMEKQKNVGVTPHNLKLDYSFPCLRSEGLTAQKVGQVETRRFPMPNICKQFISACMSLPSFLEIGACKCGLQGAMEIRQGYKGNVCR